MVMHAEDVVAFKESIIQRQLAGYAGRKEV